MNAFDITGRMNRKRLLRAPVLLLALLLVFGCPAGERETGAPPPEPERAAPEASEADQRAAVAEAPPAVEAPPGEPALRTIVLVIDGLQAEDVVPAIMPDLCRVAHCPGAADADPESRATLYAEARAAMLAQTNANHAAMMTGEYGARSGVVGNAIYNRATQQVQRMEDPALIGTPTLFDLLAGPRGQFRFSGEASGTEAPEREAGQSPPRTGESSTQRARVHTAAVLGKEKLRRLFDCTRRGEDCGPSNQNPEGTFVTHEAPDVLTGSAENPEPEGDDCPAEPAASYGVARDACIMDRVLAILDAHDPAFVLVNLGRVDFEQHRHGPGSVEAVEAIAEADRQVGRLVAHLEESGRWARTVLFVLSDHGFSRQSSKAPHVIDLEALFEADRKRRPQAWGAHGGLEEPYAVVTAGGAAMVVLTRVDAGARYLTPAQAGALARMREVALFEAPGVRRAGVSEALYRMENPRDRGHTLAEVHPAWGLGTPRVGELLVTALASKEGLSPFSSADRAGGKGGKAGAASLSGGTPYEVGDGPGYIFAEAGAFARQAPGNHGHPGTRHIPFIVASGGDFVIDQVIAPSDPEAVDEGDDTAALPEQAEVVDVAPTILWLQGLLPPDAVDARALLPLAEGRVLREAFKDGWAP